MFAKSRRFRIAALAGASALAMVAALGTTTTASASGARYADIIYKVGPHQLISASSLITTTQGKTALPTWQTCVTAIGIACYTPADIKQAYDFPAGLDGTGQSIAIIDAYGSPTVQADLDIFSDEMGLPRTTVHIYCPDGCPNTLSAHQYGAAGWGEETSLDVQWAHAIAPGATINLVVAPNNGGDPLNHALAYAINNGLGDTISMSYGAYEDGIPAMGNNIQFHHTQRLLKKAADQGISVFAASGDWGTYGGALYPASSPQVTGVGGTNLFLNNDGSYNSETVWGDAYSCAQTPPSPFDCTIRGTTRIFGATGGEVSKLFSAPAYQQGVTGESMRTTSDVSYDASVYTSVFVYIGFLGSNSGWYFFGGTSSGSPQWAAIGALADQANGGRLGQLNSALYGIYADPTAYAADFHDVTQGNNTWNGVDGHDGGTGYDMPTGLGSPDVANLISSLTAP